MSLWRIASRFFWNDWRRYVAFLASTSFAVMIYFLYTALIMHPDLQSEYPYAEYAVRGMKAAAVVIAVFALLFLLYSSSSFIRLRMKEYGLLSLLGVSRRQLIQVILGENLIIAAVSLTAGLGAGLLLLKLFLMGISALLQLPKELPFAAGMEVWLHTAAVFGGMFAAVSIASLRMVLRRNVVELVRAGRKPKAAPTFSWWRLALGLLLLASGYRWAISHNPMAILGGVIPVTLMVSLATILLMREASIACLSWLHRRDRFYYRPGPFLTVSQLIYKIQDNYRVLAAVAILVAVVLSAVGTAFSLYALATTESERYFPMPIQLVQYGGIDAQQRTSLVDNVLAEHISATSEEYSRQAVSMGILLFIGVFVSLVFVAACFSLLYSRLFTDIEEDRKHARRLQQVGVTNRELRGQALGQMAVIFFLPFAAGVAHSTMAMKALGTLTRRTVLQYGWGGALLFLLLFVALFSGAGQLYWHSLQNGLQRDTGPAANGIPPAGARRF